MAKRRVIWMPRALKEYKDVMQFYAERNGNRTYSQKLHAAIKRRISTMQKFPEMGHPCANEKIRIVNVADFGIFYEFDNQDLLIHSFWDHRRNPEGRIDNV